MFKLWYNGLAKKSKFVAGEYPTLAEAEARMVSLVDKDEYADADNARRLLDAGILPRNGWLWIVLPDGSEHPSIGRSGLFFGVLTQISKEIA